MPDDAPSQSQRGDPAALPAPADPSESPALRRERSLGTAREVKFRVADERLSAITALLDARLTRDPHGDPQLDGDYQVTSLYADTDDLEVYRRVGWHRFRKFRVRRYGASELAYLERKTRLGELVRKERCAVPLDELPLLHELERPGPNWLGADYRHQLLRRGLRPVCEIQYRRRAFYGSVLAAGAALPIRVTIDRELRGATTDVWGFGANERTPRQFIRLLGGTMVLEIKFAGDATVQSTAERAEGGDVRRLPVPAAVKELIEALRLGDRGVSKYRQCVRTLRGEPLATDPSEREEPTDA